MAGIILALLMVLGGFAGAFLHQEYRDLTEHKPKPAAECRCPEKHTTDVTVHVENEDEDEVRKVL